jgi:tyrosinase
VGLGIVCLISVAVLAQPPGEGRGRGRGPDKPPPKVVIHVRQNISAFTPVQIAALRKGVQVMQSRPASDPTSWIYQANIHGTDDTPVATAWNTCQHGSYLFLPWHRMYLYYFERILRKASGDPNLALPYWNYSQSANRALPEPFRTPTTGNPLFVAERRPSMNAGGTLPASSTSFATAFAFIDFASNTNGAQSFGGRRVTGPVHFSNGHGALELQPHNGIHGLVGGSGWMSDPNMAARDPIFWLHHNNIDRLWESWLKLEGGRLNPPKSDTVWMTTPFTFFDENGMEVKLTGAEIVRTVAQLRYRYDALSTFSTAATKMTGGTGAGKPGESQEKTAASTDKPVSVVGKPVQVPLPLSAESAKQFGKIGAADGPRAVTLKLEQVKYERGAYLEVYINLPTGAPPPGPTSPHYAGSFAPFEPKTHQTPEYVVDVTNAVRALSMKGLLKGDNINVTLVPAVPERKGPSPGAGSEDKPAKIDIGRVSIVVGQ